jgi:uncharacterized protein YcbK (DUF882 family)
MTRNASRRAFLLKAAGLAAAAPILARVRPAVAGEPRGISLVHTHTGEALNVVFALGARYLPRALAAVNHFLRDHYSGRVGRMDPALLDQLGELARRLAADRPFEVISGYRCPATNAKLRRRGGGVARHSLHMEGRAIDIRLPGTPLDDLHAAALGLRAGGVGFYPESGFLHVDTGRVRSW